MGEIPIGQDNEVYKIQKKVRILCSHGSKDPDICDSNFTASTVSNGNHWNIKITRDFTHIVNVSHWGNSGHLTWVMLQHPEEQRYTTLYWCAVFTYRNVMGRMNSFCQGSRGKCAQFLRKITETVCQCVWRFTRPLCTWCYLPVFLFTLCFIKTNSE